MLSHPDSEKINNSEDKGSGKLSYGIVVKTGSSEDKQLNYICPKYWDISRRVSIHPRDIYDRLDDIIPESDKGRFKGNTDKTIISINHSSWGPVFEDEIQTKKIEFLKHLD